MKKIRVWSIVALLFSSIFIGGCSQASDENTATIQTYLEHEFTGPNEELSNILDQGLHPPELDSYLEERYGDIIVDLESMVNRNYVLVFLRDAHLNGYQLHPKNITIKKIEGTENNVYDYEVEVEYSKDEQTNIATVTGKINLDDNRKILMIRKMDGLGLLEELRN
ncbi:hypothetical protein [Bacillus suaedaesalsae]|uniref:Lipoprotein n=1 Tax=Bacillus suaedaesalsae TaxID=2810349 RepID=A0ABS2DJE3_9BACI|nr:hypothetical protein [Bacillus suaedaesalsae]MBM6617681.1 hypothetical protein [Bacillus suaedaesalsae]